MVNKHGRLLARSAQSLLYVTAKSVELLAKHSDVMPLFLACLPL
jgi:hypothetical protein